MALGYTPSLIAWLALVQLLLYSGHTIWQKNIFICFPGGIHSGRYLFNKVNPCKLQRLHWDGWGSGGAALLVFSDLDSWTLELLALLYYFYNWAVPIIKKKHLLYCDIVTQYIFQYDCHGLFPFHSRPCFSIKKYIICPLRLAKGGPWNAVCPTTMALSLIAYFLE